MHFLVMLTITLGYWLFPRRPVEILYKLSHGLHATFLLEMSCSVLWHRPCHMPQLAGGGAMIKMQDYLVLETTGLPLATHTAKLPHSITRLVEDSGP